MTFPRVGFLGCGAIARLHALCLAEIGVGMRGGYDIDAKTAASFVNDFGGESFSNAEELCRHPDIDAVYICSRHDSHVDYIELASREKKPVYCEKPLAMTVQGALRAREAVDRADIPVVMGFNHRYSPGMLALKRELDARNGKIDAMTIQFATGPFLSGWAGRIDEGGGVFLALGSHVLDLAGYLCEDTITELKALSALERYTPDGLPDTCGFLMRTRRGALITASAHDFGMPIYSTAPGNNVNVVHVFVKNAVITGKTTEVVVFEDGEVTRQDFAGTIEELWGYREINRRFVNVVLGREASVPRIGSGLRVAELVERCRINADSNGTQ